MGIALARRDDGALHQNVPGSRELGRLTQVGFFGECRDDLSDIHHVLDADRSEWVCPSHPDHDVYTREGLGAIAKKPVIPMKPVIEHIEDGEQTFFRSGPPLACTGFDRSTCPVACRGGVEVFGSLVPGHNDRRELLCGHWYGTDDRVKTDVIDTAVGEKRTGGVGEAFPQGRGEGDITRALRESGGLDSGRGGGVLW